MKKLFKLIAVLLIISSITFIACYDDTLITQESLSEASFFQKGKPQYITIEEAQVLIDSAVQKALSADPLVIDGNVNFTKGINSDFGSDTGNMEFRNIYYGRRETAPSQEGIKFLEELNDRDWEIDIAGNGGFTSIWLDGNGADSDNNITLSAEGRGEYSKYWQTQGWIMLSQNNGIYNFSNLKTFNTNDEAKVFFSANGFSRLGTIYKTTDGTVKATY